ncbi:Wadjet anti-phage system protein JetD domain-containing protein [Collimonas humicola]|uniref:Wadjet anti-phage system protein JetD domain-containing protein n=1 Tax=Collimonas humicola TaxID=2825886 RepID=UPI002E7A1808|nr:Wadjet anti-phage system protein JetD domain-containing protein [Collimonas humicola]
MKEFLEMLRRGTRKRVMLTELRQHFFSLYPDVQNSPDRGALLLEALRQLEAAGALSLPAAASWEKIGVPPLPQWVLLTREPKAVSSRDLRGVTWAPELGFWPDLRPGQLEAMLPINEFLLRRRGSLMVVPIKERSLEIYGDEKRLDGMCTGDSLFGGRLQLSTLGCFRVPQPLPYRMADAPGKPVLVVENHNSFWSFGEWNQQARCYSAIVYGSGEAFRLTGRALQQVLYQVAGSGAEYLGDLDPKGVRIPDEFNRSAEAGSPQVRPALIFYQWLLTHGVRRHRPECASFESDSVAEWFGAELAAQVVELWQSEHWIPQESLGFEQLSVGVL